MYSMYEGVYYLIMFPMGDGLMMSDCFIFIIFLYCPDV